MRRGEYFLGRDIRVAGDPVLGRGGAALPFVTVGEPDLQVGAGAGIMQRTESLSVQPFGPAAQRGVVLVPRRDGLIIIDPGGSEDRVRKLCHRDILFVVRKNLLRPGQARIGDDVPVDVEIDDPFQRRLIRDRIGFAGARDLGRVFAGKQHRVIADDGEPRGVAGKRLRHSLIEPAGRAVEAVVRREPITRQRDRLVGQDGSNKAGPGLVGMFGDLPHQGQRHGRRRHQQVLSRFQLQPDLDGHLGETVEFDGIDRCRDVAFVCGHGCSASCLRVQTPSLSFRAHSRDPLATSTTRRKKPESGWLSAESCMNEELKLAIGLLLVANRAPALSWGDSQSGNHAQPLRNA